MKHKKLWLPLLPLALAAVLLACYFTLAPKTSAGEKQITLEVASADGAVEAYEIRTSAAYLKEAVEDTVTLGGQETEYGYTVFSVNGEEADFTSGNAYWAIYVNGKYGNYSIDKQPVADGDAFRLVYETQ